MLKEFITPFHTNTSRDYFERMNPEKPFAMEVASKFEEEYWDGDRKFGYGGYKYDGRWKPLAEKLIQEYDLTTKSSVIDLGCGKAFLLYELAQLLPGLTIHGLDLSQHAINTSQPDLKNYIRKADLNDEKVYSSYEDKQYDLCLSIMTLHNLALPQLERSIQEIQRISKRGFIAVESYRNWSELCNLQSWALTCKSFFSPSDWEYLFEKNGFSGDYEFLYFT